MWIRGEAEAVHLQEALGCWGLLGAVQELLNLCMQRSQAALAVSVREVDVQVSAGRHNVKLWVKNIDALHVHEPLSLVGHVRLASACFCSKGQGPAMLPLLRSSDLLLRSGEMPCISQEGVKEG